MTPTVKKTVVFVCPHGAGMSRLAAAFFNRAAPRGWQATSAGLEPAETVNTVAVALVSGSPTETYFDLTSPRPVTEVSGARTVAINCTVPGADRWDLTATTLGEPMREELRTRVEGLVKELSDAWLSGLPVRNMSSRQCAVGRGSRRYARPWIGGLSSTSWSTFGRCSTTRVADR